MEGKYWELREKMERAWDKYMGSKREEDYWVYVSAGNEFKGFCAEVLEKLMEDNADILARLK